MPGPKVIDDSLFVRSVRVRVDDIPNKTGYPFNLPCVRDLEELALDQVTIFVGENGSGKSTLIEAIAVAAGFNPEGGGRNFNFSTMTTHSPLGDVLTLVRGPRRPRDGFFLRAESYYNVATEIERLDAIPSSFARIAPAYGGEPHRRSHGESFLALVKNRLRGQGLYIFDEPEAALSPLGCLTLLRRMHELVEARSQVIFATHSPLLMAYPGALIYHIGDRGPARASFDTLEHVALVRDFLNDPGAFLGELFSE